MNLRRRRRRSRKRTVLFCNETAAIHLLLSLQWTSRCPRATQISWSSSDLKVTAPLIKASAVCSALRYKVCKLAKEI